MPVCLRSHPSCHASLKFAGYSNLLNGDILKMSNLKLSQPGVCTFHSSLDMHDAAHTMMISDIATSAWLIDFCHKAI